MLATRCSGAGLVVAHSETIAGVLFADAEAASFGLEVAAVALGSSVALRVLKLRGGGIDVVMVADECRQIATGHPMNGTSRIGGPA